MQRTKNTGMYNTCIAYDSDSNPQVIVFIQTNDRLGMTLRVQNFISFRGVAFRKEISIFSEFRLGILVMLVFGFYSVCHGL